MNRTAIRVVRTACLFLVAMQISQTAGRPADETPPALRLAASADAIYTKNPNDSWNRIFYYLFSRRVMTHLTSDFPEGAPFRDLEGLLESTPMQVSTRTFERVERGDRAIDPLYPSFLTDEGARVVLQGPNYVGFRAALDAALQDNAQRSTVARAIMQNDLWSAHDMIYKYRHYKLQGEAELAEHRVEVLERLGHLIQKVALRSEEIRSLADNYAIAKKKAALPDLFKKNGGWVEIQWFPRRLHDEAVGYRRVTRVFLKPAHVPGNIQEFLNDFRRDGNDASAKLDGVALIVQLLLIDEQGRAQTTGITTDVQFRLFERTKGGDFQRTRVGIYELSRKQILNQLESGGLSQQREGEPAYLPSAGNDYTFASTQRAAGGPATPLVVKARSRCAFCHGDSDLRHVMTFSMNVVPGENLPAVRRLDPAADEAARFVISQKTTRDDWKSLHQYFAGTSR